MCITVTQDKIIFHQGIIVGKTTTHYKVYDEKTDILPNTAEWLAKKSKVINCH